MRDQKIYEVRFGMGEELVVTDAAFLFHNLNVGDDLYPDGFGGAVKVVNKQVFDNWNVEGIVCRVNVEAF